MSFVRLSSLIVVGAWSAPLCAEPIIVDADNKFVGFYSGLSEIDFVRESGVSQSGYRFSFDRDSGRIIWPQGFSAGQIHVYFVTSNCTGAAYVSVLGNIGPGKRVPGTVIPSAYNLSEFPSLTDAPLYYLPQTTPSETVVQRQSWWTFAGAALTCQTSAPSPPAPAYEVLPNNPTETRVPNVRFVAPLRIISSWIFRNGFEGTASIGNNELQRDLT